MIAQIRRVSLTVSGMAFLLCGVLSSSMAAAEECDLSKIRELSPNVSGSESVDNRAELNEALSAIQKCISLKTTPLAFTLYRKEAILEASIPQTVIFEATLNSTLDNNGKEHADLYVRNQFMVPSSSVFAVSVFGRIDASGQLHTNTNDAYLQILVDGQVIITFYKGQEIKRTDIGGSVFLWLKEGQRVSVDATLASQTGTGTVVLRNTYLSLTRVQ